MHSYLMIYKQCAVIKQINALSSIYPKSVEVFNCLRLAHMYMYACISIVHSCYMHEFFGSNANNNRPLTFHVVFHTIFYIEYT